MIAPVVDFLGSLPPLIYTHLFSLRFRWTTSSVNNRNGRCRRNWKIHVRADTDRADSSECKYRPNNRTPSLLLKKEEGDHPGRSPIGPGLDQVHLVFKKKRRNFPLSNHFHPISSHLIFITRLPELVSIL